MDCTNSLSPHVCPACTCTCRLFPVRKNGSRSRPRQILAAILSAKYRIIERAVIAGKISRCWVKSTPDTWISLFLTRSARYTAQDEIMSPKYHWDSLWIDMILEELINTCVEARVEKPALRFLRNVVREVDKIHVFRGKMEQNIQFLVPGSAKYRRFRSNIIAAKCRGERIRSRICLGLSRRSFLASQVETVLQKTISLVCHVLCPNTMEVMTTVDAVSVSLSPVPKKHTNIAVNTSHTHSPIIMIQ